MPSIGNCLAQKFFQGPWFSKSTRLTSKKIIYNENYNIGYCPINKVIFFEDYVYILNISGPPLEPLI